jgi:hypothetical protein
MTQIIARNLMTTDSRIGADFDIGESEAIIAILAGRAMPTGRG